MTIDLRRVWYLDKQEAKTTRKHLKKLGDWARYDLFKNLNQQESDAVFKFLYHDYCNEHINFNMTFVETLERDTGIQERVINITSCKSWRVYCIYHNAARPVYPPKYLHDLAHWCVATPEQIQRWYECQLDPNSNACKLNSIPTTCERFDEELTVAWELAIKAKYNLTGLIKSGGTSVCHTLETARARLAEVAIDIDNDIYLAQ